jgi:transcription elongation factor Elf1
MKNLNLAESLNTLKLLHVFDFSCPACGNEVGINQIVEKGGNLGCISCLVK